MLALLALAAAGTVPDWSVKDFGESGDLVGNKDGWQGGYSQDPWAAYRGSGYPLTDDNTGNSAPAWGTNSAQDNWIVKGSDHSDVAVSTRFETDDDDTFGVVARVSGGGKNLYILAWSADSAPQPGNPDERGSLLLYRISGGKASVVDSGNASLNRGSGEITLVVDGGNINGYLDGKEVVAYVDADPLPAGKGGLYSYDAGGADQTWVGASEASQDLLDFDSDKVADDNDNCEETSNSDQADKDKDGIGDACDDPGDPTDDTAVDTGGGGDSTVTGDDSGVPQGDDSGTPVDSGVGGPGVVRLEGNCGGCSTGAAPALLLGLLGLGLSRRRR